MHQSTFGSPGRLLMLFCSGVLIGGGAILPGISGGVLCVAFGIYRPMMAFLAHPIASLRTQLPLFVPVGLGWAVGFFGFAGGIEWLFESYPLQATCLFLGLIAGTFPGLWHSAGKEGRTKGSFFALFLGFALLFGILTYAQYGLSMTLSPSLGAFLFCGILWGLSLIVPGMTSSSILMSLGLYLPLTTGIAHFDPGVLLPMLAGITLVVALGARLINRLFDTHYALCYHAILGIVLASILVIVPLSYGTVATLLLCLLWAVVGFGTAFLMERWAMKNEVGP